MDFDVAWYEYGSYWAVKMNEIPFDSTSEENLGLFIINIFL